MQKYFFTTLVIILIMVGFAVLNTESVTINFGFTKVNTNLSLTIFVIFAIGALVSFFISAPGVMKARKTIKKRDKEIKSLDAEIASLKEQLAAIKPKETPASDTDSNVFEA